MSDLVVVTRRIAASPATVFSFFSDVERWTAWQGVDGTVECRPGGTFRLRMPGGEVAAGNFVELVPARRVVFTSSTSALESVDTLTFEPRGRGCEMTYRAELRFKGSARVANPLLAVLFRRLGNRARDSLREVLGGPREDR